jgi:hypothetical protein
LINLFKNLDSNCIVCKLFETVEGLKMRKIDLRVLKNKLSQSMGTGQQDANEALVLMLKEMDSKLDLN